MIRSDEHKVMQVEKARQEIRERLDPSILAFLEKRAAQRKAQQAASKEVSAGTQVKGCILGLFINPWECFLRYGAAAGGPEPSESEHFLESFKPFCFCMAT